MQFQKTIKSRIELSGTALHSGEFVYISINPAPVNSGIIFVRTDIESKPQIKAMWSNVVDTELSTVLGNKDGVKIATVEHMLSSLRGLDIDNAVIEVSGNEMPILDGSTGDYVDAINRAGIEVQDKTRKYIQVIKPVSAHIDDKFVYFLPAKELKITCRVNYKNPNIGLQHLEYIDNSFSYINNISKAKTFGFLEEVEDLQKRGFALGGSYENAIVIDSYGVVNRNKMSYDDEFVRHKILDIIGDIALTGSTRLMAHIVAYKTGHKLNNLAVKELFNRAMCFKIVEEPVEVDEKAFVEEVFSLLDPVSNL
ncbi:MAG: UDP-3-O-acyl-N-acetylglucosamine deacetylase [Proteobacteria bacterium]|nr:UDP-3-O-acyl-N-acetylglucosamine deacetylase [Pseudomonadota bacterium]